MTNSTNAAKRALEGIEIPLDPDVEFTAEDAAKARGWSMRKARQVLLDETRAGHLSRRLITRGYENFYAYRITEKPDGA
jgi:hypothetical protein